MVIRIVAWFLLLHPLIVVGDDGVFPSGERQPARERADPRHEKLTAISQPQESLGATAKATRYGMGYESRMQQLRPARRLQNDQQELSE